jgi:hypothetical protein
VAGKTFPIKIHLVWERHWKKHGGGILSLSRRKHGREVTSDEK